MTKKDDIQETSNGTVKVLQDRKGLYNWKNANDELLSDIWFDEVGDWEDYPDYNYGKVGDTLHIINEAGKSIFSGKYVYLERLGINSGFLRDNDGREIYYIVDGDKVRTSTSEPFEYNGEDMFPFDVFGGGALYQNEYDILEAVFRNGCDELSWDRDIYRAAVDFLDRVICFYDYDKYTDEIHRGLEAIVEAYGEKAKELVEMIYSNEFGTSILALILQNHGVDTSDDEIIDSFNYFFKTFQIPTHQIA